MKKYFIDLDNTLCVTSNSEYEFSQPIIERIQLVNKLKLEGNHITIWTARGTTSGIDHKNLTLKQLNEWRIQYDELIMGKPNYDVYLDDKSFNIDAFYPVPKIGDKSKKITSEIVEKGWGKEIIFVNNPEYCGKILCFNKGKKFSMHYHVQKKETWYVAKGRFILNWIETENGINYSEYLEVGDVITNERGEPHQLVALEDSEIFEVSTRHYDEDSFRVKKGD
uniref:Cupin domain-containing protein n=1 Tax=viral metagenome TaxID=1070528 RepID=A0A6C0B6D9_9ZZZZ